MLSPTSPDVWTDARGRPYFLQVAASVPTKFFPRSGCDVHGRDPRDRGVHGSGTSALATSRSGHRYLDVWLCGVRDAHGSAGVRRWGGRVRCDRGDSLGRGRLDGAAGRHARVDSPVATAMSREGSQEAAGGCVGCAIGDRRSPDRTAGGGEHCGLRVPSGMVACAALGGDECVRCGACVVARAVGRRGRRWRRPRRCV